MLSAIKEQQDERVAGNVNAETFPLVARARWKEPAAIQAVTNNLLLHQKSRFNYRFHLISPKKYTSANSGLAR